MTEDLRVEVSESASLSEGTVVSWTLHCPWCKWYILVGDRGGRGDDYGAGVEAAELMQAHIEKAHARTWPEFLAARMTKTDTARVSEGTP